MATTMSKTRFAQLKEDLLHRERFTGAQEAEKVEELLGLGAFDQPCEVAKKNDVAHGDHMATLRECMQHRWRFKPDHQSALWAEFLAACEPLATG